MRGGFLHQILLTPVESFFREAGANIYREYPVAPGRNALAVDLFIQWGPYRIVCEAELTPKRIQCDAIKAAQLKADLLLIVVPDGRTARAAKRRLTTAASGQLEIWVLPLGVVLQRLEEKRDFVTGTFVPRQ